MFSIRNIVERRTPPYKNKYEIVNLIGSGAFGKVFEGKRKDNGCRVAMKMIDRRYVNHMIYRNGVVLPIEYELMTMASSNGHQGIIKPYEFFECLSYFLIVMEFPENSIPLLDYINKRDPISEIDACVIFRQILMAVQECHNNGVIHRDLKLDNMLINVITGQVKLIDFGSGERLTEEPYQTIAGSTMLHPPEWFVHGKYYGEQIDTWALGITLYRLIQDKYPFDNKEEVVEKEVTYDNSKKMPSGFCKELITLLLTKNPAHRIQLHDVPNHIWMKVSQLTFDLNESF